MPQTQVCKTLSSAKVMVPNILHIVPAVMGKAGKVIETRNSWTTYEFIIARIIGRFTTVNITDADINQNIIMRTKSNECPCQTMVTGRHYLVLFNFKATGQVTNLFPNGRVYLWQTVRDSIKDDALRCKRASQASIDTSPRSRRSVIP